MAYSATAFGLDSVDNTADMAKPVSTAQQIALDAKVSRSLFDADTILKADTDDTPSALSISASSIVGRLASGGIGALSTAEVLTLLGRTDENIQDLVGAMVSGNTETGITVTYNDTDGKLDFSSSGGTDTAGWWGDGSDGAVVMDGANTFAAFTTKSGNTYTLIRDLHATTLDVSSGITLECGGYRVLANVSITNVGTIHNNGSNSGNQNGGTAAPGQTVGAASSAGAASTTTNGATTAATTVSLGFGGGAGGAGSGGTGGTAGSATAPAGGIVWRILPFFIGGFTLNATSVVRFNSATGGGGGGGNGTQTGGGGGGGGGLVIICSPLITNVGTISAKGGNGFSPTNPDTGGGGGGGAGSVRLLAKQTVTGTLDVSGGTGGTGNGSGANGTNGTTGAVYQFVIAT